MNEIEEESEGLKKIIDNLEESLTRCKKHNALLTKRVCQLEHKASKDICANDSLKEMIKIDAIYIDTLESINN